MSDTILVAGHNSDWKKIYRIQRMQLGEVNRLDELHYVAAGKGANTARALICMGERVLLVGYAGGINGSRFLRSLREEGISHDFQKIREETRTCVTILEASRAASGGAATELIEPSPAVTLAEARACERRLLRRLPKARILILSGTSLEGSPPDCYRRYVEAARRHGVPVVLDSYKEHGRLALEASPAVLKINRRELESIVGQTLPNSRSRREAYRSLRERFGLSWVVITSGPEAMEGYDGEQFFAVSPPRIEALNPIGSGDAATAGIAASFARGESLAEALRLGAAMGSANCLTLRTGQVDPATVGRLLETLAVDEA